MRHHLLLLVGVAAGFASAQSARGSKPASAPADAITSSAVASTRFLVEFKETASLDGDSFTEHLKTIGIQASVVYRYSPIIFKGLSIELSDAASAAQILELADVASLKAVEAFVPHDSSSPDLSAQQQPSNSSTFNIAEWASSRTSTTEAAPAEGREWSQHRMTGVDQVHKSGNRGKGVKIGFVDSGADYMHPGLGAGFGPGFKVAGGYDLMGDRLGQVVPDADPRDRCAGTTGTMWLGITAVDDPHTGIVGVAPDASYYLYRTMNCFGRGGEDMVLAAMQRAYEDGVDVLALTPKFSIGIGGAQNRIAQAATRLVEEGMFVTMAAIPQGRAEPFAPFAPSMGKNVAAVGSVEAEEFYSNVAYATIEGEDEKLQVPYSEIYGLGFVNRSTGDPYVGTQRVMHVKGVCAGAIPSCVPKDLSDLTVLVARECPFDAINDALKEYKAMNVLVYNVDPEQSQVQPARGAYGVLNIANMDYEAGQIMIKARAARKKVTIEYDFFRGIGVPNKQNPRELSDFTGWGPDTDGSLWPPLVAPGNPYFTTCPMNWGSYLNQGGTGASQAYVAGVAALWYAQNGGRGALPKTAAAELLQKMINTADPLGWSDGYGENVLTPFKKRDVDPNRYAPVAQQGGGLVNASALLMASATLSPSYIKLGDDSTFKSEWQITIKSDASVPVTYSVGHKPSISFTSVDPDGPFWMRMLTRDPTASVEVPSESITLAPGESKTFTVKITKPEGMEAALLPVFSGYIELSRSTGQTLRLPYQGIAADIKKEVVIWHPLLPELPLVRASWKDGPLIMPGLPPVELGMGLGALVVVDMFATWPSDELAIDVVTWDWALDDWSYPLTKNYVGPAMLLTGLDDFYRSPIIKRERQINAVDGMGFQGVLANGTVLPDGNYKLVLSTLLPRGDRTKQEEWQIRESGQFIITRTSDPSVPE